jgi:hypothetical protein
MCANESNKKATAEQQAEYDALWLQVRNTLQVHEDAIVELENFVARLKVLNRQAQRLLPPEGNDTRGHE